MALGHKHVRKRENAEWQCDKEDSYKVQSEVL